MDYLTSKVDKNQHVPPQLSYSICCCFWTMISNIIL